MAKTNTLPFTQNLINKSLHFNSSDQYQLIQVAVTGLGSNLTPGTRTFTAAGGTTASGGAGAATWTQNASGAGGAAILNGPPSITNPGQYIVGSGPTAAANAATVDSGSSNATFALTVGILKLLHTAGSNDDVIKALMIAGNDSSARVMSLWTQEAGSSVLTLLGGVNVPLASGSPASGTVAAIDMLGGTLMPGLPYDANGKRVLPLVTGQKVYLSVPAITASCFISAHMLGEAY